MSEEQAWKRVLVGFDGAGGGRDALELSRQLASTSGAAVEVATIIPYGPLPVPFTLLAGEDEAHAEALFAGARRRLRGIPVTTTAFAGGTPAEVLTVHAEREEVDLIAIGSPHRGPVGRALVGSVGAGLLHGSARPVAVAPRGYSERDHEGLGRIAVAYDGTPEAEAALRFAERLARVAGARIRVLTVVAPPIALPGPVGYTPQNPPQADRLLVEAVNSVDPEVDADGRRLDGSAAPRLAEAAGEDEVDLLVVGSRGYGPVMRVLLGSVSTRLIHEAPCPVLVVPRP